MKFGMSRSRNEPDFCLACDYALDPDGRCPRCHSHIIKKRPPHMAVLAALQAEYDSQPDAIKGRFAAQARIEDHLA